MVGNTREWVSKQMSELQRRGLIFHCRGEIVILDEAGLRQLITPPPRKHYALLPFWSSLDKMCEVVHTVNYFTDREVGSKL